MNDHNIYVIPELMTGSNTNQILSKYFQVNLKHEQAAHSNSLKI